MFPKPQEHPTRCLRLFREASRAMNVSPPTARARLGCEQWLSLDATLALRRRRLHDGMNFLSASVPRRLESIRSVQLVLLACGPSEASAGRRGLSPSTGPNPSPRRYARRYVQPLGCWGSE